MRRHALRNGPPVLLAAGGLALAALAGCGQKGPLYIPDESGAVVVRPGPAGPVVPPPPEAPPPETQDENAEDDELR